MAIITLYGLFGNDIQTLAFTKSADVAFDYITCFVMGIFLLEILLACISKEDYFLSFYFWLDMVSTLTLISDIDWIVPNTSSVGRYTTNISQQARAGRAARIIRLIRLIRLMRISKVFKQAQLVKDKARVKKKKNVQRKRAIAVRIEEVQKQLKLGIDIPKEVIDKPEITTINLVREPEHKDAGSKDEVPSESKISKAVSDLTIQRVVILILILAFILPLFQAESYLNPYLAGDYSIDFMSDAASNVTSIEFKTIQNYMTSTLTADTYYPLIYLSGPLCGTYIFSTNPDDLRDSEKGQFQTGDYTLILDLRINTRLTAGLSLCRTVFLCILLAIGSVVFSRMNTNHVLLPLDSMFEKAKLLATNPMAFSKETDKDLGVYSLQYNLENPNDDPQDKFETQFVEERIVKFAKLLAVQYGDAGKKIIVTNLASKDYVNPLIPGEKMYGVFGFCIINSFVELTEVLQTDILEFLNAVAETVHATVDKYLGSTNKNIGESFLLAWKFPAEDFEISNGKIVAKNDNVMTLVDLALFAYLKIIAKIAKLVHLKKFTENQNVQKFLPQFALRMGFGLHIGWGIEGAVGSKFKIDASYLSPNVNIAARLESCTRQYGIPLLFSGQVYNMLSPHVQEYCREIDNIMVKGSKMPIKIYTVDLDTQTLKPKECKYAKFESGQKKERRLERKIISIQIFMRNISPAR